MTRRVIYAVLLTVTSALCGMGCCAWDDSLLEIDTTPVATMGDGAYTYGATTDGETLIWRVSFADVEHTPDWIPGQEPPLPVSEALRLAEHEVPKYTTIPGAYDLEQIEWRHIGNYMDSGGKWIYLVTFERRHRYEGQYFRARGTLIIPVLLDGRVIEGRK